MLTVAVKNVWFHKRRLIGTLLAIALGAGFLSGTRLLGDTLSSNFDRLFSQANGGTDVVVRSATKITTDQRENTRAAIDASLVTRVQKVPGVAAADPYLEGYGQLLGADHKGIGGNGPPTKAANWIADERLNPYRLVAGRAPRADDEVVINRGAAKTGHLALGDTTTLLTPDPVQVRIVGISTFGTADGFGPSTFTGMTLHAAQQHLSNQPQLTAVLVKAAPGVSPTVLAARVRQVMPASVQTTTGAALAAENVDQINNGFLGFVKNALLVFASIALLVAAFSIHNAFSILAAQRSRDTALLRAVGATRRQVVGAAAIETVVVGLVGSVAGCAVGVGLAALLKVVFAGFGFALPTGGLVVRPASVGIALATGLIATVVAGLVPAVRAGRIAPLEAVRELTVEGRRSSRVRIAIGAALTVAGAAAVVAAAMSGAGIGVGALGALLTITGVLALGPAMVGPAATALVSPIATLRGITGALAGENASRNPRRTSATAAALLVGVSVVTLFTAVASSLKASATDAVDQSLIADVVVSRSGLGGAAGGGRFSPRLAADIATVPSVQVAAGIGSGSALLDGTSEAVTVADLRTIGAVLDLGIANTSPVSPTDTTLAVSKDAADARHWSIGTSVAVTYPDGTTDHQTVGVIFRNADVTGDYIVPSPAWAAHDPQPVDRQVLVALRPGSDRSGALRQIQSVATRYGNPTVQTRDSYRSNAASGVNTILGLVYVMLALAIVIALMGVANTLSLSIHERRRELGLLRAVGQTRAQARAMVRWESVIISLLGTITGVLMGLFLGWALVHASSSSAITVFSVPPAQVITFVVVGALSGVLAGIRPARRAARIDILQAIAAD